MNGMSPNENDWSMDLSSGA
ncbi:unnamed protein product, partial [Rotaria sp. Silwood1]